MPREKKDMTKSEAAEATPTVPAASQLAGIPLGEDTLETPGKPEEKEFQVSFPVVGIGASAGGLEAFEKFFTHMPPDSGMAFVLVQHLSAPHKSILNDLVQRLTRMKVYQVTMGMEVQPNCVYIIPPNKDMALLHGKLHLLEPGAPRGLRLPIDFFFRSLAQDQHERAICIVLSGTGSDGTLGLKAVKGEGGMVMAQDAHSAKYDGMPRSAVNTGMVDYVLPPEEMPQQLIDYVKRVFDQGMQRLIVPVPETSNSLQRIFILLRAQVGHDFSYYKQNTIHRRIERRMAVNQIGQLEHYARYLQQNPLEVETLFRELLIGVTNFFRDTEAFATLEEQIIPPLLARAINRSVRVWIPGCSTGEEAYSIAMLLREHVDKLRQDFKIQIFATDIDSEAIAKARAGIYPNGIVADVSPERLSRFFDQDGDTYRIKKSIRDMVVFAEQNVVGDPPFSKIDLISCRNLLIYLQPELQKRVLPLFHYSLRQDGILFLGNSETVGEFTDLFAALDRKWKVYQRQGVIAAHQPLLNLPRPPFMDDVAVSRAVAEVRQEKKVSVRELAESALLRHYTPACAIVNEKAEALYIHGHTGKYLEPAPGEASLNIIRMAREGLRLELTTAIRKAITTKSQIRYTNLTVKTNGHVQTVNLTVRPVLEPPNMQGLFMVLFEDVVSASDEESSEAGGEPITDKQRRIKELERELRAKEEYLQTTIEELETSNEELQSTNEELQSSNEEMQSTNEELETSKEELQSVNEELVTVNAELQKKIDDLSQVNNDMNNLLAGTGVGTVFVDRQLCIQRFTPAATHVINFIQSDIGRPVGHIASNLVNYDSLVQDAQEVLDSLIPRQAEVQTKDGAWYLLRIWPYRTLENVIEGVVITFVAVSELKQTQEQLEQLSQAAQQERDKLRALVDSITDEIWFCDAQGNLTDANIAALRGLGYNDVDEIRQPLEQWLATLEIRTPDGQPRAPGDAPLVRSLRGETIQNVQELVIHTHSGERMYRRVSSAPVQAKTGEIMGAVAVAHDITARTLAEEDLRESEAKWRSVAENSPDYVWLLDREGNIEFVNRALPDWSAEQMQGAHLCDYVPEEFGPVVQACLERVLQSGEPDRYETESRRSDGAVALYEARVGPLWREGEIVGLVVSSRDVRRKE